MLFYLNPYRSLNGLLLQSSVHVTYRECKLQHPQLINMERSQMLHSGTSLSH